MALNPNHAFEDLDGTKCSIVEKNCTQSRVDFLKKLLEFNKFVVVVVKSPPPKVVVKPAVANPETPVEIPIETQPTTPETFSVGVTDVGFDPITAVFNRQLKTFDGKIVSSNYWKQREEDTKEQKWYWEK